MGGYCIKDGYGFIVTDFMPGETLFDFLHKLEPCMVLNLNTRYRIALGIAQGLSFLHHDCVPQIIHRDVKSDNIFMDSELEPKIGDFRMSKMLLGSDSSSTRSRVVGTLGYMASVSENAYSIRLTEKVDVYSHVVFLLELFCRELPVDPSFEEGLDILSWTRKRLKENDECICFLDREISFWDRDEQQKALLELALECTETVADKRPSMRYLVGSITKSHVKHERSVYNRNIPTKIV